MYKTLHRKQKIEQHKPHKNRKWTRIWILCLSCNTTLYYNPTKYGI